MSEVPAGSQQSVVQEHLRVLDTNIVWDTYHTFQFFRKMAAKKELELEEVTQVAASSSNDRSEPFEEQR